MIWWISCCWRSSFTSLFRLFISIWRSWIVVGLVEEFYNLLSMLLTSNLLFVIKSFCLGFTSKVFLSFSRKTFFFWGSGMELIASNKRSCSLVRVLICLSSSSVDDNWSSGWIKFKFLSKSTEDKVSVFVSSSEVSMSKLFICSSIVGSRLRFLNFFFSLQYLLMWPCFPQL